MAFAGAVPLLWFAGITGLFTVALVEILVGWAMLYALGVGPVVRLMDAFAARQERLTSRPAQGSPWVTVVAVLATFVAFTVLYSILAS